MEAIAHQAATLNWLTQEIQALRQENDRLRQQLQQSDGENQEMQQLREELGRLQQQNQQLQDKCDRFEKARQALLGIQSSDDNGDGANSSSTTTTQTDDTSQPKPKRRRRSGGAVERAKSIFDAISVWNQQHPDQACAVNASLLEREFGINRNAARTFETEYAQDIQQLHNLSGVENASSHNRGLDFEAVKKFVSERV